MQALQAAQQGALGQSQSQQTQLGALQNIANGQFNVNPGANPWLGATTQVGTNQYIGNNPQL